VTLMLALTASVLSALAQTEATSAAARADAEGPAEQTAAASPLTLSQALDLALRHNPELVAAGHDLEAAEAGARQAGALPNPELELEAEEFGGRDQLRGFGGATTTLRISQPLELGGKRARRQTLARIGARLAAWDRDSARLDLRMRTKQAFVALLAAQERLQLAEASHTLAEEVKRVAAARVKAGKVSELEATRADVEAISADIARARAERDVATARMLLAAHWGGSGPPFSAAAGSLEAIGDDGPLETNAAALIRSPDLARWDDQLAASREELALAEAQRLPDLTVSAGLSRFAEDDGHAFVAAIALPLPLFDRRQGAIAAARHQTLAAAQRQRAALLQAEASLAEIAGRLASARAEALTIRDVLLPAARQAFEAAQSGYREGKFEFLEVLDAQRSLQEVLAGQLDVCEAYHTAAAEWERLTATTLETIAN
jgi:cobalt-zinc-cadmium efflux system outer membrane protein